MSNLQFKTHESRPERLHDNLQQVLDNALAVRSSTALTANGVTPVASRIDVSGKVATLTLNFTTAGAVTGTVYTIDDFNLNPSAVIYATGGSANGISQVSLLVTVTPSAGPPAPALIDINALSPTLAGSINFIQVTYMLA